MARERARVDLTIAGDAIETLHAEAVRAAPDECCGLLLGQGAHIGEARPAANVAADPRRRFEIDPRALIDAFRAERIGGPEVLGYYHSHPSGPAGPSAVDKAMAHGDGRIWAIVGDGSVTFWRDDTSGWAALSYAVEGR